MSYISTWSSNVLDERSRSILLSTILALMLMVGCDSDASGIAGEPGSSRPIDNEDKSYRLPEETELALASCNGQPATLACSPGAPSCVGTAGDDVIAGSSGPDVIEGRGGNDLICGENGDDVIRGGRGSDTIWGGRGADTLRGGRGHDILRGERGMDLLYGEAGDDDLRGGQHDDFLHGGNAGNDFCGGGSGDDTRCDCEAEANVELFCPMTSVAPETTDPAINDPVGGDHLVYVNPSVLERDELLVHLPGTGGSPANNSVFLEHVANQGMKAIGLQYVNNGSVNAICTGDEDPDCQEKLRQERIYGIDTSPLEIVSPANSLVHRLVKLLEWLDAQQPTVGWGGYLIDGAPRWDRIVISGHSQGSGMAALIARDEAVARVLMFGGPSDVDDMGLTAAWITDPKATPINRHFGFRHVSDPLSNPQSWVDMGLSGPPVIVDDGTPPYGGSHYLETDVSVAPNKKHGSVIHDPVFSATWQYMCCSP